MEYTIYIMLPNLPVMKVKGYDNVNKAKRRASALHTWHCNHATVFVRDEKQAVIFTRPARFK